MTTIPTSRLPAWSTLERHRSEIGSVHLRDLFDRDPQRFHRFSLEACGLFLDYSKNRITDETLSLLRELAEQTELEDWVARLFAGEEVNASEGRAALHVALRQPDDGTRFPRADHDVMPEVCAVRRRMRELCEAVHAGGWRGHSGEPIRHVVAIGIGGSALGPALVTRALAAHHREGVDVHFVSGLDSAELGAALAEVAPEATLFLVSSKSFGTEETLANAHSARDWLFARTSFPPEAVARHFVAITASPERAAGFGIPESNVLELWDWVGGRYSLWSAVGLPAALATGMDVFEELLAGAHEMDRHFASAPMAENMPVLLGLLGVWYRNFLGASTRAVLPYDYALRDLPAHLQQLEMESNGKRVSREGAALGHATCPIVWGGPGNDGQHAFFQLLHQGTELVPCDFIVPTASQMTLPGHADALLANAIAQTQALMRGRTEQELHRELSESGLDGAELEAQAAQRALPGNQPSNTILYECLTPRLLGALVALYEHRVFVQSVCWGTNPFDQWGVELGKKLAATLRETLAGAGELGDADASTRGLVDAVRRRRGAR